MPSLKSKIHIRSSLHQVFDHVHPIEYNSSGQSTTVFSPRDGKIQISMGLFHKISHCIPISPMYRSNQGDCTFLIRISLVNRGKLSNKIFTDWDTVRFRRCFKQTFSDQIELQQVIVVSFKSGAFAKHLMQ